jgi:hypothetical protein
MSEVVATFCTTDGCLHQLRQFDFDRFRPGALGASWAPLAPGSIATDKTPSGHPPYPRARRAASAPNRHRTNRQGAPDSPIEVVPTPITPVVPTPIAPKQVPPIGPRDDIRGGGRPMHQESPAASPLHTAVAGEAVRG